MLVDAPPTSPDTVNVYWHANHSDSSGVLSHQLLIIPTMPARSAAATIAALIIGALLPIAYISATGQQVTLPGGAQIGQPPSTPVPTPTEIPTATPVPRATLSEAWVRGLMPPRLDCQASDRQNASITYLVSYKIDSVTFAPEDKLWRVSASGTKYMFAGTSLFPSYVKDGQKMEPGGISEVRKATWLVQDQTERVIPGDPAASDVDSLCRR